MKIVIANDHAAPEMKFEIMEYLKEKGHEVINVGTDTKDSCDYADFALPAAQMVADGRCDCGVLICGTGIGISIAANKVKGIRAAVCSDPVSARLTKLHNNANMIAFGARIIGIETAYAILDAYLNTEFEGGRHQKRIDKVTEIENL